MTLIREISDMAQQELFDRYPNSKTEITMVQSYYMPSTNATHFLIIAFVNNRSQTGSGSSASMAVKSLIKNIEEGR
jgi:hypothetical protein